jgi:hypothetical protein
MVAGCPFAVLLVLSVRPVREGSASLRGTSEMFRRRHLRDPSRDALLCWHDQGGVVRVTVMQEPDHALRETREGSRGFSCRARTDLRDHLQDAWISPVVSRCRCASPIEKAIDAALAIRIELSPYCSTAGKDAYCSQFLTYLVHDVLSALTAPVQARLGRLIETLQHGLPRIDYPSFLRRQPVQRGQLRQSRLSKGLGPLNVF